MQFAPKVLSFRNGDKLIAGSFRRKRKSLRGTRLPAEEHEALLRTKESKEDPFRRDQLPFSNADRPAKRRLASLAAGADKVLASGRLVKPGRKEGSVKERRRLPLSQSKRMAIDVDTLNTHSRLDECSSPLVIGTVRAGARSNIASSQCKNRETASVKSSRSGKRTPLHTIEKFVTGRSKDRIELGSPQFASGTQTLAHAILTPISLQRGDEPNYRVSPP